MLIYPHFYSCIMEHTCVIFCFLLLFFCYPVHNNFDPPPPPHPLPASLNSHPHPSNCPSACPACNKADRTDREVQIIITMATEDGPTTRQQDVATGWSYLTRLNVNQKQLRNWTRKQIRFTKELDQKTDQVY